LADFKSPAIAMCINN